MAPENLRKLSWRSFKAAIYSGVAGVIFIVTIPNPSYRDGSDTAVRIISGLGFGLILIMLLSCLISLMSGAIAWRKGSKQCSWIILCALIVFAPLAVWLAVSMNL